VLGVGVEPVLGTVISLFPLPIPNLNPDPLSPCTGQRYKQPVELIDIFPTLNDLLGNPINRKALYGAQNNQNSYFRKFIPLQGKSLAPAILGEKYQNQYRNNLVNKVTYNGELMPDLGSLNSKFAITQTWRCAPKVRVSVSVRVRV
jgi:hypothetical protein